MNIIEITPEQIQAAITEGVRQSFAEMFADLSMRHVIGDGVMLGVTQALSAADLDAKEAITEGVFKAFDQVYGSEIIHAIGEGTRMAMSGEKP